MVPSAADPFPLGKVKGFVIHGTASWPLPASSQVLGTSVGRSRFGTSPFQVTEVKLCEARLARAPKCCCSITPQFNRSAVPVDFWHQHPLSNAGARTTTCCSESDWISSSVSCISVSVKTRALCVLPVVSDHAHSVQHHLGCCGWAMFK